MRSLKFASLILLCATSILALVLPALGVVSFPEQFISSDVNRRTKVLSQHEHPHGEEAGLNAISNLANELKERIVGAGSDNLLPEGKTQQGVGQASHSSIGQAEVGTPDFANTPSALRIPGDTPPEAFGSFQSIHFDGQNVGNDGSRGASETVRKPVSPQGLPDYPVESVSYNSNQLSTPPPSNPFGGYAPTPQPQVMPTVVGNQQPANQQFLPPQPYDVSNGVPNAGPIHPGTNNDVSNHQASTTDMFAPADNVANEAWYAHPKTRKVGTGVWLLLGPVWIVALILWSISPQPNGSRGTSRTSSKTRKSK